MRDSQANYLFWHKKNLTKMITTRGEHSSFTAIRNDQKWRRRRGDRSSWNIAHSDAGRAELPDVPHGMFGNMNFTRQRGDNGKAKCEILKQKTTEARKHIYHLGKLKKGHRKVQTSRTGTPRRAAPSHEASGASLFNVFDSFAQTMGLPESWMEIRFKPQNNK